ncbi:MAG: NAD-dependent epimerase/dehydratase family protein [Gammaproteobacteria bacterium]
MKALVTGGGGFLGGAIVRALLERGGTVRTFQRGDYPVLNALGVEVCRGDLVDKDMIGKAAEGCDIVFHVAAKAGVWGDFDDYYRCNVSGTRNVIDACLKNGVSRLIYTSTPSVVFKGDDEENIDATIPYPSRFFNAYQETKALAERSVLKANRASLATVALRPHLIWGPGDPHLVPRIVERARRGKLRMVGERTNLVDSTYIDNAALAHILAVDHLQPGSACAGKAYFISNGEPIAMAELINRILAAAHLPPVSKTVSPSVAYAAGTLLENIYKLLRIKKEPLMTRFVARQLASAHWFDLSAAKRDLGYEPVVSIDEGMQRLEQALMKNNI